MTRLSDSTREAVHLITGEFPPQPGGVSDYTCTVANGLAAAGLEVHVWCPGWPGVAVTPPGVVVHRIAGAWRRDDLARLDRELNRVPGYHRLLVQWVPHAFGQHSLNVGFCAWLRRRARSGDTVDLVVHEAFLAFGEGSWKQDAAAAVHRVMATMLLRHAHRVWVSIPAWGDALRPFALGRALDFEWLPVPSNVPRIADAVRLAAIRQRLAPSGPVVGHFSTYEAQIQRSLTSLLPALVAQRPSVSIVLMGHGSERFRSHLISHNERLTNRVTATGALTVDEISLHLQACDLVVQPYPDGASARRTTLMAALENGVPVVTTEGRLTETLWRESGAVRTVAAGHDGELLEAVSALCDSPSERQRLSAAGRALYTSRFDIRNTIAALLSQPLQAA